MKILIAGLVENIQVVRLKEEAEKRGHLVEGCYAADLMLKFNDNFFEPTLADGRKLSDYDLIYFVVGNRRWEWYTAGLYLAEKFGTIIVNQKTIDPNYNYYLTPAIDYLRQAQANLPYPKSTVVFNLKGAKMAMEDFSYPVIVKTSAGRQGRGVFLCNNFDEVKSALESVHETGVQAVVIREFVPNDGDLRIFTVGYKAIGAMKRMPTREGEFRSNISQGGRGEKFDIENYPEIRKIAENAAEITRTEIAGVDIIINKNTGKPYILEVNPSPQFEGLEKFTGVNAALEIVKYFEELYNRKYGKS
jgi:RimK family alpha-L-glutamate ligase